MTNHLVILASSPRPDPYFNIVAYNARHGVQQVVIACVEMSSRDATDLQHNFNQFVFQLQHGKYASLGGVRAKKATPLRDPAPMETFFKEVDWGSIQFTYKNVADVELPQYLKEQQKAGASFDVTTCKNSSSAGSVAWLVSRGGSPIHTFEMSKKLSFDEGDLLPYLTQSDYSYPDLSRSLLIRSAIRRVTAGTLSKKRFWLVAGAIALAVALLSLWLPPGWSNPIFAFIATLATIISAVSAFVRYSD